MPTGGASEAGDNLLVGHSGAHGSLQSVSRELDTVRTLMAPRHSRVALDAEAMPALQQNGDRPLGVLHVAMHADVDAGGQPFLLLGPERLHPHDVVGWRLHARLVDLAACSSGAGPWLSGEGTQGFARAFLATGSQHVLSAAWLLHDDAAATFGRVFYTHLDQGAGDACHRARRALRHDQRFDAPFYWASWCLVGTP